MSDASIFEQITRLGVVPVIAIDSAEAALPLADALLAGGLPIIEITFRTAAAAEVIELLCRRRPEIIVGAGTILTTENLEAAGAAGARFGIAPGMNPQIVARAQEIGLPFVPGVATASDIECALSMGSTTLKFFPSQALGGVAMLRALAAPFSHTGLRFVPTGGINPENLESYLSLPVVAAAGGTWIAKKDDIAAGRWPEIRDRCKAAVELVARARR